MKQTDWKPLENLASKFIKEKQPFERLHVSIADLKKMFRYSKYKMYYIDNLLPPEGSTVYRNGSLVDLCLGPHIQNTNKIKAFQIIKVSCFYHCVRASLSGFRRILLAIFSETPRAIRYNEYTALLFPTRNNWQSTKLSLRRLRREIIAKLVDSRSFSSLMNYPLVVPSSNLMAPGYSTLYKQCYDPNMRIEATEKSSLRICMTLSCGRGPAIISITKMTCLF